MAKVSASILSADFGHLAQEIIALDATPIDYFHLDIMDNHFVPNLSFGPDIVAAIRQYTSKPFDVHLMVTDPERYFVKLKSAGANYITFHIELTKHHDRLLSEIKDLGLKAGIALNPSTPLQSIEYLLDKLDLVLIMTVNPGFGGQSCLFSQLNKIVKLKEMISNYPIEIFVDGGVNDTTGVELVRSGADVLVAGSFILSSNNYLQQVELLRSL